jgi:integrase
MLDYATKRRIIAANPMYAIDAPTVRRPPSTILTVPQIQRFLTVAANDCYNPLWLLLVQTGMRRGEALGVRWSDIDLVKGRLQVRQAVEELNNKPHITTPKTKAALRTITLFPESIAALKAHKARQNAIRLAAGDAWRDLDLVFATRTGRPLDPRHVLHQLRDIQREANGLPRINKHPERMRGNAAAQEEVDDPLPYFRIHDLRHTHATHLLQEGWPVITVSRRLGHANPAITLAIYAHAITDIHGDEMQTPAAFRFGT